MKIVNDIKAFFKGHLAKMKALISQKQSKLTGLQETNDYLNSRLQMVSLEVENLQLSAAENQSKVSRFQEQFQQMKINRLVMQDETGNFKREIGKLCFFFL